MDDPTTSDAAAPARRPPSPARRSAAPVRRPAAATLTGALATATVGLIFATVLPYLLLPTVFGDLVPTVPLRSGVLAPVALAVAAAAAVAVRRVDGWWLALAGLLLVVTADRSAALPVVTSVDAPSPLGTLAFLAVAVGTGLTLGGVLLAVGTASGPVRAALAGGLAVGVLAGPAYAALLTPAPTGLSPELYWVALAATGLTAVLAPRDRGRLAALLTDRRRLAAVLAPRDRDGSAPPSPTGGPRRRPDSVPTPAATALRRGPVIAVTVAGLIVLGGLLVRWWVIREFRVSPDGLAGPRREAAVESFAHYSAVAVAVVAGLLLLGYAHRAFGIVGARWVALGFAVAPVRLVGWHLDVTAVPGRVLLVAVTGLAAVVVGVTLARQVAGLLPWDALGVAVAAVALPLAAPVVRAELPSAATVGPVLVALGTGLAVGFGLTHAAAAGPPAPQPIPTPPHRTTTPDQPTSPHHETTGPDRGRLAGVAVLGFATWALTAQALAPVAVRPAGPTDLSFTLPLLALAGAVTLVLLFALTRLVARLDQPSARP
ncbi:hypothetical protein [Micromonospora cathayae]|uniref:ABC-2 type transport system permease protein n=1 Tax=Micromonospora cathayae TaxID=3028804 RepID=A0ABY7ZRW9_9ACTN|nr:hypothetical protein [Micromonospora sp. HUAS 3]WDZ85218.1 hypothetical protein PVK37_01765 [Micromonospora sp. HUAS 3]